MQTTSGASSAIQVCGCNLLCYASVAHAVPVLLWVMTMPGCMGLTLVASLNYYYPLVFAAQLLQPGTCRTPGNKHVNTSCAAYR